MLTRLKVSGFKNLVGVDIRFGPFTCVAGANGVGKSNLFDAIRFLSALADRPLIDAALSVRDEGGRTADVRSLFHRVGDDYEDKMSFEAEMIIPQQGLDDLGQKAKATITFLRYKLILRYRVDHGLRSLGNLELLEESLTHINLGEASKNLLFDHKLIWRKSAIQGRRTSEFISTKEEETGGVVKLHQDGGGDNKKGGGRPSSRSSANLPRTVLSVANAAESPTVLLAKREMQSWKLLQLEPSSMRKPDEFTAPFKLGTDGSHLPATLYHLARFDESHANGSLTDTKEASVYAQIANRLSELVEDVQKVSIDRDERRELLTIYVIGRDGTSHPARALSDGTLRFLALAVLDLDSEAHGLICLEEPENGIHPERIPAILNLLQEIATDVNLPISSDNPLRQVIINTHSPSVVLQVPEDSLVVAELKESLKKGKRFKGVCFSCLDDTWRGKDENTSSVAKGRLLAYLNPVLKNEPEVTHDIGNIHSSKKQKIKRVVDREDIKQLRLEFE